MQTGWENSTEFRLALETDCTVLITGPTGAGKSTLARRIHDEGVRRHKPWMAIHLSSLHEGTLESQLFGHERGAFTGALNRHVGLLERANGGTLFLDEIGELSPSAQARFLEVLQTKTFLPLGATTPVRVDVRVICATNRDLEQDVRAGRFREDLYHRIRMVPIALPALKDRAEDFNELVHGLIEELARLHDRRVHGMADGVAEMLENYSWPGNYRELRNVLEFAMLASRGPRILEESLPSWFLRSCEEEHRLTEETIGKEVLVEEFRRSDRLAVEAFARVWLQPDYDRTMRSFERAYLQYALRSSGTLTRAAARLQLPKSTLSRRASDLGIAVRRPASEGNPSVLNANSAN